MRYESINNHYFYLTNYFHQLKEKIPLYAESDMYFDNPTEDEIQLIYNAFENIYRYRPQWLSGTPVTSSGLCRTVTSALKKMIAEGNAEPNTSLETDPLRYLASIAIIIRYDNADIQKREHELSQLKQNKSANMFVNENQDAIRRKREVDSICGLLSYLIVEHDREINNSFGQNMYFISAHADALEYEFYNNHVAQQINSFVHNRHRKDKCIMYTWQLAYPQIQKYLEQCHQLFQNKDNFQQACHMGALVTLARQAAQPKVQILIFSAILECLLIKGNSYITEQFTKKISLLLPDKDQSDIADLYPLRCKIAHGNFKDMQKTLEAKQKELVEKNKYYSKEGAILSRYARQFSYITHAILRIFFLQNKQYNEVKNIEVKVNINKARQRELKHIVHIDDDRAQQIITLRPFHNVESLTRVSGIGNARVQDIIKEGVAFVECCCH